MAWWGTTDVLDAAGRHGLPDGAPSHRLLARPDGEKVTARSTPVRTVPLGQAVPALAAIQPRPGMSASLLTWRAAALIALGGGEAERFEALAESMPAAAHAMVDGDGVWTAYAALTAFAEAVTRTYLAPSTTGERLVDAKDDEADTPDVEATLRPYQRNGVAWLRAIADHGRGALLADDMGLGKTLQAIALIAGRSATDRHRPHVVVCPTSVLGNWARELRRFAPGLGVLRHHGPQRAADVAAFEPGSVVVTSYQVMLRDIELFASVDWDVVVLDEAQQIKNRQSQTAKAARLLPAHVRVALTGTPMENRLSELWSIMDFANPGLLGTHQRFVKRFAEPIELRHDGRVAARLRQTVEPYLLRRLKNDVADDLPAKQESIVSCTLTAEQAKLYRGAVSAALDTGFGAGIARHGRILKLLTQLKQICNHPAQFLGTEGTLRGRSGKLDRVTEMLAEAVAEGSQTLIFTQFRTMGELLARHLGAELGIDEVPFLHGGVSQPAREVMVDRFQGDTAPDPILIVSLKAGGTGLNLTAATNVVHYDRWWNPAVEDQATDRAHRIGQTRPVDVYKLVTGGTLEERIADMLERKRSLTDAVIGTGEDWVTNLDDRQLRKLIELSEMEVA